MRNILANCGPYFFFLFTIDTYFCDLRPLWAKNRPARNVEGSGSIVNNFSLGVGLINRFPGSIQVDAAGGLNTITSFHPFASGAITLNPIIGGVLPTFEGALLLPEEGAHNNLQRLTYYFLGGLLWSEEIMQIKAGIGPYFTRIWGPGGSLYLENGNGHVDFPLPARSMTAMNIVANLGCRFLISTALSFQVDVLFLNLFGEDDRNETFCLGINFHWGVADDGTRASKRTDR